MRLGWIVPLIVLLGCEGPADPSVGTTPQSPARSLAAEESAIPADLDYSILSEKELPPFKRSLIVLLPRKVPMSVLRTLAIRLRDADPTHYDRTFIFYYLPGWTVNHGSWATSHFDPELEVKLFAVSAAESERDYLQPTMLELAHEQPPQAPDGPPPVAVPDTGAGAEPSPVPTEESLSDRARRERAHEIARRHAAARRRRPRRP